MDVKLGTDGDIVIQNGDLVLVDGVDAVAQEVSIRLKFFLGEWFLDRRLGVPYFERVLGQKPRLNVIRNLFRDVILGTPGMVEIQDLIVDYDGRTRKLSVSFTGVSTSGKFEYDKELIVP